MRRQEDDGLILDCVQDHGPALLLTDYNDREFSPCQDQDGLFRYRSWLPIVRTEQGAGRTVVYRSDKLGPFLGLANLWIAFSGYWPERGAFLETGTFKELEAYTVLARMPRDSAILTVASSGNTGAAFGWVCSVSQQPCLLVVPAKGLRRFVFRAPLDPCVRLVVIEDGDYPDAISFVNSLAQTPDFQLEGGIKNVGRRDGLATVLLSAFEAMQRLPRYYFQAVGSGTGAIAVHEAARRLRAGVPGLLLPRLMLCQNSPFTPIHDAWQAERLSPGSDRSMGAAGPAERYRHAIGEVHADELTNWSPPYQLRGGIRDSLAESDGDVLLASSDSARVAQSMFFQFEDIDIEPAAAVAVACLRDAVASGRIDPQDDVLLNVTGGGRLRAAADHPVFPAVPQLCLTRESLSRPDAVDRVADLCAPAASAR
jgi:cysteate synthase